jgi:hypothetical protein
MSERQTVEADVFVEQMVPTVAALQAFTTFMLPEDAPSGSGFTTVPVGTDSTRVATQAWCVLRALRAAANRRFILMGWADQEWQDAAGRAEEYEYSLFQSAVPSC